MDRPDYLSDDDDFQGVVKAERNKILHATRNAAQTPRSPSVSSVSGSGRHLSDGGTQEWPQPKPLPNGLAPVAAFDIALLPETIAPWVADIAERMQCPPDFVAIPAMVALGAVIGRKTGIRPQRQTDWTEVANLWGCIIGRPGVMKTPATQEALKPLHRLETTARDAHAKAGSAYARELELFKLASDEARNAARNAMKRGAPASLPVFEAPQEPKAHRYVINDTTYEALGEILSNNPNGVLAYRDELVSLLKTLDREEYVAARDFFLQAWSGTSGYTFDRIIRGNTHIEAACLSLLGSTQPGRIAEYVRRANRGGLGDDGLIQRFGLFVWPDQSGEWKECDRWPDSAARKAAWATFERLDTFDPDAIGAEHDPYEPIPFLRFGERAQDHFAEWRAYLEKRVRADDFSPALESHFAKYRSLVPALALISHLTDGASGPIGEKPLMRALAFAEYLETHARRVHGSGAAGEVAVAKLILARVRKGDLTDGFCARDIRRKEWSGLTDNDQIKAGLDLLADFDLIAPHTIETPGRPRTAYIANPRSLR